jgi:NADP-dependent 3-hydroxy acid dehydrogenase YdfG
VGELLTWGVCRTEKKWGQIDVLVNNAGTNYRRPFHMFKFEDMWRVIEVNFKAVPPRLRDAGVTNYSHSIS